MKTDAVLHPNHYIAIVTGASSGIGLAISRMLCDLQFEVYGYGRDFSKTDFSRNNFHPVSLDLRDTPALTAYIKKKKKIGNIYILVHAAGCAYYGLHEELSPRKISDICRTNLEVPMILSQMLLRNLKKEEGYIFSISSICATSSNPHGACYGATKAGLSNFNRSLFEESRKSHLKVVTIAADMTDTNLYRNADFGIGTDKLSYLTPEEVADTIKYALSLREGAVMSEILLRPQLHSITRKK
mgnify:CR=1 FL=1